MTTGTVFTQQMVDSMINGMVRGHYTMQDPNTIKQDGTSMHQEGDNLFDCLWHTTLNAEFEIDKEDEIKIFIISCEGSGNSNINSYYPEYV